MTLTDTPRARLRLVHYVLRTNQLEAMVAWYCTLLQAKVNFSNEKLAFLSYDEEHHRVAFVAAEPYAEKPDALTVGFYHAAFAFDSLGELLENFTRLKRHAILPWRTINHGPTVSMYYQDPDGNDVEMQVDVFPDSRLTNAWMQSDAFARNPVGVLFDPEDMIAKHAAGVPAEVLMRRPDLEASS